ncbi:MAG: DUF4189 domain-containing protein [Proteobacteria bacterium]|nr:DUF4189 domain-containing protein [Pseudomonadota bacterium]
MKTALLGAAAVLIALAAVPANAGQLFGAIAISQNASNWGKSYDYSTQEAANDRALSECRGTLKGRTDDCKLTTDAPAPWCVAVAVKYQADGTYGAWGSAAGKTTGTARVNAMDECAKWAKDTCSEVVVDLCSQYN